MVGNQDAARARADQEVKRAQEARDAFKTKQYERGDSAKEADAIRNLAAAQAARADLG